MKTPAEIRELIAKYFPRADEAMLKKMSVEEAAVYTLARLLDAFVEFNEHAFAHVLQMMSGGTPPPGAQAPMQPSPNHAMGSQPNDNGASWVMAGLNENDKSAPPGQPGAPPGAGADAARWVMEGIDPDTRAGGPGPAVMPTGAMPQGGPAMQPQGGPVTQQQGPGMPTVIPNPSSPPMPPEIAAMLAKQAAAAAPGAVPPPPKVG